MLACASDRIGRGWGFGLHEALDQIGAILGPLVVAVVFSFRGTYQAGFAFLLIPALIALTILFTASRLYPRPQDLGSATVQIETKGFPKAFWIYIVAIGCIAAGYADFPLVAFHFKKVASVPEEWIPIFYAVAMGVDAIAALIFGRLFDRLGFSVLIVSVILSALFAPLVFLGGFYWALAGMALWGVGMGAQESIIRAAIAGLVSKNRLGFAYGLFNMCFGLFWFLGSVVMGTLYDTSVTMLIVFSVTIQVISIPLIVLAGRRKNQDSAMTSPIGA